MKKIILLFIVIQLVIFNKVIAQHFINNDKGYLYADTIYPSPGDPTVIFNKAQKKWYLFYTQRRPDNPSYHNLPWGWAFKCNIGYATSANGKNWAYQGIVKGLITGLDSSLDTFWAPDVFYDEATKKYHLTVTVLNAEGEGKNIPTGLYHYTSKDCTNWNLFDGPVKGLLHPLDGDIRKLPNGTWRLWYKNMATTQLTYTDSKDLLHWGDNAIANTNSSGEGPNCFKWKGYWWMLQDPNYKKGGFHVSRSVDATNWVRVKDILIKTDSAVTDNGAVHCDVVTIGAAAYIFYHVAKPDQYEGRKNQEQCTVIEVAKLAMNSSHELIAIRNKPLKKINK